MRDAGQAVDTISKAALLNREDPLREGSLLVFPDYGQVVMTGDLHGHSRNFERIQHFCALEYSGPRHVVLHEIIHPDLDSLSSKDDSHEVLLAAARWKCEFPDQVHFLLSNHELFQTQGNEITKNGRIVTMDFEKGVREKYGSGTDKVLEAIHDLVDSYPLAGRTPNRVFLSHSLPSPRALPTFDPSVLSRVPTAKDLEDRGSAHAMVWGRYQTEASLNTAAELLDVDFFLCGHQPQETGYEVLHDRMVILASDHNHGVFLPFDLAKPVTLDGLVKAIRPLAAIE